MSQKQASQEQASQEQASQYPTSLDRISLLGLRAFGRHGVLDRERTDGQEFIVDAVLFVDTGAAAATDDLSRTVDYASVAARLAAIVSGEPVNLIETLAERLAAACLADALVQQVQITVHKPSAPVTQNLRDVTVSIRRSRQQVPPSPPGDYGPAEATAGSVAASATGQAPSGQQGQARRVVLALGSNLGDRLANLQAGLDLLCAWPGLAGCVVSPVYQTAPVGGPPQGDFLNAVLVAESAQPARSILDRCQAAEAALHRARTQAWGPRTLDVDVIACGDEVSDDPVLTLPHPRAHQRVFVLAPWHDVDPDATIPGRGRISVLLAAADRSGVRRLPGQPLRAGATAGPAAVRR